MNRILPIFLIFIGLIPLRSELSSREIRIELHAKRYSYSPEIIRVKKGDLVAIKLISDDVAHGFYLDGYGVEGYAYPGEFREIIFRANKTGRFTFRCSITCGEFHPYMVGYLYVSPNYNFLTGVSLLFLFGIVSLVLTLTGKTGPQDKLFGIIPTSWRLELTKSKLIKKIFKSRWFPLSLILVNLFIFTVILVAGFVGGYSAGNYNFGIMIVWILWWTLLMLFMVPVIGRLWCMVCPFPLFGDWLQRGKLVGVGRHRSLGLNKRWPNALRNLWPLVLLFFVATWFSGFFTVRPFATFLLLAIIIGLATIIALIYGRRTFCLFVCPVSGFQGLYSNFSLAEVRVKDPEICKNHNPKTCVTGSEKGYGCPWMELPFDMNRNTYCGLCTECIKTCPYDNMVFNLRPPGVDLLTERRKTDDLYKRRDLDEAFKALTMLGIFYVFFKAYQSPLGHFKDMIRAKTLSGFFTYVAESTVVDFLIIPLVFLLFVFLSKKLSGKRDIKLRKVFVNFSYTLVPIGLAVWAAFSIGIILPNGSYLLHILSDPFAWGWDLFGTAKFPWKPFMTGLMPYLQILFIIIGFIFSLEYGFKLSRITYGDEKSAKMGWIPILIFLVGLNLFFIRLFVG
jgi:polyferredoxin